MQFVVRNLGPKLSSQLVVTFGGIPAEVLSLHSNNLWLRAKVKTQGGVTAVDGNKRGDLELVGYIGVGAQDLVLDISFRRYLGGAAPRSWHMNGELLHPGMATLTRTLTRRRRFL